MGNDDEIALDATIAPHGEKLFAQFANIKWADDDQQWIRTGGITNAAINVTATTVTPAMANAMLSQTYAAAIVADEQRQRDYARQMAMGKSCDWMAWSAKVPGTFAPLYDKVVLQWCPDCRAHTLSSSVGVRTEPIEWLNPATAAPEWAANTYEEFLCTDGHTIRGRI